MTARRSVSAKDGAAAVAMLDSEKRVAARSAAGTAATRRCIGSAKFGIEAHEAPVADFPAQPSQKDGLGRMCKTHWNQYTTALRKAAVARKAADGAVVVPARAAIVEREDEPGRAAPRPRRTAKAPKPEPIRTRPARGSKTEGDLIVEAVDAAIVREAASIA